MTNENLKKVKVPDGSYQCEVTRVLLTDERLSLELQSLSDSNVLWKNFNFSSDAAIKQLKTELERIGVNVKDVSELESKKELLLGMELECHAKTGESGFTSVYLYPKKSIQKQFEQFLQKPALARDVESVAVEVKKAIATLEDALLKLSSTPGGKVEQK